MTDINIESLEVSVTGSPETVELLVDVGPQGTRGSKFYIGLGDPNLNPPSQDVLLNDVYINVSPGVDYSYLYQYISKPGGDSWEKAIKINPSIFSKIQTVVFEPANNGEASITIPVNTIVSAVSGLTAANFAIQYSIAHTNVVSSSMSIPELAGTGENLVINLKALEYVSGAWQELEGTVTVHLFISIV